MLRLRKGVAKFGGKKPNKAAIKLPLRDGDIERDDEAYKGHYFINANSTTAPQIVDRAVKPMGHSDIGVTMNTYTHLSLDDAKNEMIRMEELEQARKEVDKAEDKKPMKQNMFKVV